MINFDTLVESAKQSLAKMQPDDNLHTLSELGVPKEDEDTIRSILSIAGVIRSVQGTPRVYFQSVEKQEAEKRLEALADLSNEALRALSEGGDTVLTKSQVVEMMGDNGYGEDDYYNFVSFLSKAELATSAGKGRGGGIALYEAQSASDEIEKAVEQIEDAEAAAERSEEEQEQQEKEHEKALYPSAAKLVTDMGYQAITLGVARRFPGEWNTPDILGYRVNRLTVLCGGSIDCITVEVKWRISKSAIAEANSHQRLAHRSYLLVHQELESIEENHLVEILDKGVGLICLRQGKPVVHSAARRNHVEDTDVDNFLQAALDPDALKELRDELARYYYHDIFSRLMPKEK